MNIELSKSNNDALDAPSGQEGFSTAPFTKKSKKRLLPDIFYPGWQLELLSSLAAIFLIMMLPFWIDKVDNFLFLKYGIEINSSWTDLAGKIIISGYISSFILRMVWLRLVWKCHASSSSLGDKMFKKIATREMRLKSIRRLKLAITLDEVSEFIFFIFSFLLFVAFLSYFIQVGGSVLDHTLFNPDQWHRLPPG